MYPDHFDTADQVLKVFDAWHVTEPLPKKGMAVRVCFPGTGVTVKVTRAEFRSTYGKALYRLQWIRLQSVDGVIVEVQA